MLWLGTDRRARDRSLLGPETGCMSALLYDVVIPTVGRDSLASLLRVLTRDAGRELGRVVIVDDRPSAAALYAPELADPRIRVVCSKGRGPAAARNVGIQSTNAP